MPFKGEPPRVVTRWQTHVPAERRTESTGRAVADALGDLVHPDIGAAEQILRNDHPPGKQVFHWRLAKGAGKALEEGRARKSGNVSQLGHRPRTRKIAMHLPKGPRQVRIGQPPQ
ncbi:hypothetical protein FQZ97_759060 [compost metagenome]